MCNSQFKKKIGKKRSKRKEEMAMKLVRMRWEGTLRCTSNQCHFYFSVIDANLIRSTFFYFTFTSTSSSLFPLSFLFPLLFLFICIPWFFPTNSNWPIQCDLNRMTIDQQLFKYWLTTAYLYHFNCNDKKLW